MERWFFHIRMYGRVVPDEEGMALPDLQAAQAELRASARDLYAANGGNGLIELADRQGNVLATMPIRNALH